MNLRRLSAAAAVLSLLLTASATAAPFQPGLYRLGNHPGANLVDPPYGLRLDGLVDGDPNSIYTFDFEDAANGAAMFLDYDGSSFHIFGNVWGGLDIGDSYQDPTLWMIDVTYGIGLAAAADGGVDDIQIDAAFDGTATGTISSDVGSFSLTNTSNAFDGSPFSFRVGDEDGNGHRGFDGISAWGWLDVDGNHTDASDWNFTLTPVPLPAGLWLLSGGLAALGLTRRRN